MAKQKKNKKHTTQNQTKTELQIRPKTENQAKALDCFENNVITVIEGLAGTGKTYLALFTALKKLMNKETSRIILTRPLMTVGNEKIGFLPGDVDEKTAPYTEQLYEYLDEFAPVLKGKGALNIEKQVEFIPIAYLRGRNFKDAIIIVDEAQNTTPLQLKTVLTRIGENTKVFVIGDVRQSDHDEGKTTKNGLTDLISRLKGFKTKVFGHVKFGVEDIQRSEAVKVVMRVYNDIP